MRICLVSAFPPSHERTNEYGYHLAHELQRNPVLSVTVLADEYETNEPELPDFDVVRCWRPDQWKSAGKLLEAIRECKPDVVWFNLVFSTFRGNNPFAFVGLCLPMITRLMGYSTHVTLHHVPESVNRERTGIKHPLVDRVFGWLGTRLLLFANSVTVLLPDYRKTLLRKYRGKNVHLRAHGNFAANPEPPDFSQRGNPQRVLAFGKWGTYKRLEMLLEAFESMSARMPNVELVIAGEDHPNAPGYLESLRHKYGDRRNIKFTGYVGEGDLSELFRHSSVMVLPYMSANGANGVAHLAAQFGVPVVCADIPDFRDMAEENDLAIEFFAKGNAESLAESLTTVLKDQALQVQMAEQNFSAAVRMTMPTILSQYVRSFRSPSYGQQTHSSASTLARFARWTRTRPARAFANALTIVHLPTHSPSVARVNVVGMRSSESVRKRRKREELERWRRDRVA